MKILLVDDVPQRLQPLQETLTSEGFSDIVFALSAMDARRQLRNTKFGLAVIDICLPNREVDTPSDRSSLELLTDIVDGADLIKPSRILGLTAYDASETAAASSFRDRTWSIVRYADDHDGWIAQIVNAAKFVRDAAIPDEGKDYRSDVAIITALRVPEYDQMLKNGWSWDPATPIDDTEFCQRAEFASKGRSCTAILAVAPRMGMIATALLAAKMIYHFRPRLLVMTGICAGIKGKTELGDVIFADPVWDYQSGKHVGRGAQDVGFEIAPHQLDVAAALRAKADQLRADKVALQSIRDGWSDPPNGELKLHIGPVASGSAVVADSQRMTAIKQQKRDLIGVEMELYGLFAAAHQASSPQPQCLAFKSVCDFADEDKHDSVQRYAAYTSARIATAFLERFVGDL